MAKSAYEAALVFSCVGKNEKGEIVNKTEEEMNAYIERFEQLIKSNVGDDESVEIEKWGKRTLAYLINDEKDGYFVFYRFNSEPDFPAELNRVANITDYVLRIMVIKN